MGNIQAVIFDLDDTLVDRRSAFRAVAETGRLQSQEA